jgi:hypothetical protein
MRFGSINIVEDWQVVAPGVSSRSLSELGQADKRHISRSTRLPGKREPYLMKSLCAFLRIAFSTAAYKVFPRSWTTQPLRYDVVNSQIFCNLSAVLAGIIVPCQNASS